MGVTLSVTGNGFYSGSNADLSTYSVTEDSTPIDPSDTSGGTGTIEFTVVEDTSGLGTILLLNDTVQLADQSNGSTQGTVNTVDVTDHIASITADGRLNLLVANVDAAPYTGTLGGAFTYYLSLVGITSSFVIDSTITARAVTFPGFSGSLWDYMKQMTAAQQVEISLVSTNIVLRPLRTRIADVRKDSSIEWNVTNGDLAQNIEVYYYNNQYVTNGLLYPPGGWTSDVEVYSVDAGVTTEFDIDCNASILSIQQPVIQTFVAENYTASSVYTVAGNDGLPIPPAQWLAGGGSLNVSINEDTQSLHVVLTGMVDPTGQYAPYSISVASGPSDYYSTLRIVGTGVTYDKQLLTIPTGVPLGKAATTTGVTIDNPFINTYTDAATAGMLAAGKWASPQQTITVSATVINRTGEKGNINYPTFVVFDSDYTGKTFAQFDTTNSGQTFANLTTTYFAKVQDNFDNQAFGNVNGARVLFRNAWYRIRTATITEAGIQYTAERDTILSDFDSLWTGKTFAQFDTRWTGKTFQDYGVVPLWT